MKKINQFISVLLISIFLTACSTETEITVKAENVEFSGMAGEYLKVVEGDYKFTNNGNEAFITIELELINKPSEKVCEDYYYGGLRINAIGDGGQIFDTGTYGFTTNKNGKTKILDLLNSGNIGDKKSISFEWDYYGVSSKGSEIFSKSISFEVIDNKSFIYCSLKEEREKGKVKNSITTKNAQKNDNNSINEVDVSEWDDALDSYEEYIDKYIKLMNKVQNGDASAMTEYPSLMEKTMSFTKKMENAGDELTPSQMTRFLELQNKFTTAMSKLNLN